MGKQNEVQQYKIYLAVDNRIVEVIKTQQPPTHMTNGYPTNSLNYYLTLNCFIDKKKQFYEKAEHVEGKVYNLSRKYKGLELFCSFQFRLELYFGVGFDIEKDALTYKNDVLNVVKFDISYLNAWLKQGDKSLLNKFLDVSPKLDERILYAPSYNARNNTYECNFRSFTAYKDGQEFAIYISGLLKLINDNDFINLYPESDLIIGNVLKYKIENNFTFDILQKKEEFSKELDIDYDIKFCINYDSNIFKTIKTFGYNFYTIQKVYYTKQRYEKKIICNEEMKQMIHKNISKQILIKKKQVKFIGVFLDENLDIVDIQIFYRN